MRTLLLLSIALLSGCRTYNLDDQKESVANLGTTPILRELDSVRTGETTTLSPKDYLRKFNAIIVEDPTPKSPTRPRVSFSENGALSVTVDTKEDIGWGSAAVVTKDGYFVTANHVIDKKQVWLVFIEQRWDMPNKKLEQTVTVSNIRTVFKSKRADFAIIKAPITGIREHLNFRFEPIEREEPIYSGGWMNATGAGFSKPSILYGKARYNGYEFREIQSSIPVLPGDSGSAVIDTNGDLCGVSKQFGASRFTGKRFSVAIMLEPRVVSRIIENDRDASKSLDTTRSMHSKSRFPQDDVTTYNFSTGI